MSIYDSEIPADIDEIYMDESGFAETHSVDGINMLAVVHASTLSTRSALLDLGTFGADRVCIVRCSDYGSEPPEAGSIFFLDGVEYRVSSSGILGGRCVKISLQRVEG